MEIRPILSALLRNKTGAVLIAMQIALTLAILCNAVFIIHDRIVKMDRPTGMDTDNQIDIDMTAYAPDLQRRTAPCTLTWTSYAASRVWWTQPRSRRSRSAAAAGATVCTTTPS